MDEFYELVEHAIDCAFEKDMYLFKAYDFLKHNKIKRKQITEFIESSTAGELALTILTLMLMSRVVVHRLMINFVRHMVILVNQKQEKFLNTCLKFYKMRGNTK